MPIKRFGLTLPQDVKASWLIHDGQSHYWPGVLFHELLSPLDHIASSLQAWRDICADLLMDDWAGSEEYSSLPPGAVACRYTHPMWVPLAEDNQGNYLGIDLAPGPKGVVGQVIPFGKDEWKKSVLAPTWAHLLEDMADELEAGNVRAPTEKEHWFGPDYLPFHSSYEKWARAKLPSKAKPGRAK